MKRKISREQAPMRTCATGKKLVVLICYKSVRRCVFDKTWGIDGINARERPLCMCMSRPLLFQHVWRTPLISLFYERAARVLFLSSTDRQTDDYDRATHLLSTNTERKKDFISPGNRTVRTDSFSDYCGE